MLTLQSSGRPSPHAGPGQPGFRLRMPFPRPISGVSRLREMSWAERPQRGADNSVITPSLLRELTEEGRLGQWCDGIFSTPRDRCGGAIYAGQDGAGYSGVTPAPTQIRADALHTS